MEITNSSRRFGWHSGALTCKTIKLTGGYFYAADGSTYLFYADSAGLNLNTTNIVGGNFTIKAANDFVMYDASATPVNVALIDGATGNATFAGELVIKYVENATQPTLTSNGAICLWKDTDDANKIYIVFRRGSGDYVKVQLT